MSIGAIFFVIMQRYCSAYCLRSRFFIGYWIKMGWISILALFFLDDLPVSVSDCSSGYSAKICSIQEILLIDVDQLR